VITERTKVRLTLEDGTLDVKEYDYRVLQPAPQSQSAQQTPAAQQAPSPQQAPAAQRPADSQK
jgi:hypothetical protein